MRYTIFKGLFITIIFFFFNSNIYTQESFEYYMTKGVEFMEKSQHKEAISNFNNAAKENPENPYPYYLKGQIYLLQGKWDKAISDLNIVVEKRDTIPNTYYYLGYCFYHKKDTTKALTYVDKCLKLKPTHREALVFRLSSYTDRKMFDDAKPYIDRALKQYPNDGQILYYHGLYLLSQNDNAKSLSILEKSYSMGYKNDESLNTLGAAYFKLKMYSKALIRIDEAIAFDPSKNYSYINKALLLNDMNISSLALENFEKAIELGAILSGSIKEIYINLKK